MVFPVFEHFCIKVRIYRVFLAAVRTLFMFILLYYLRFACLCFVFEDQNDSADVCPTSNARFCRNTRTQCPARATTPCLVVKPPPPHPNTHSLIHTINRVKHIFPQFQHKQTHIHVCSDSLHLRVVVNITQWGGRYFSPLVLRYLFKSISVCQREYFLGDEKLHWFFNVLEDFFIPHIA